MVAARQQQYMKSIKAVRTIRPRSEDYEAVRSASIVFFEKYGQQVQLRPADAGRAGLSGIDSSTRQAKSHIGAIGVMQVMPATGPGAEGRRHPPVTEPNIHAGAKYMDQLMTPVLPGRKVQRAEPHALRVCELQRRAGQHLEDAHGSQAAAASIPTSGSTTSRWSPRRRSAWRPRPTCATSSSTTSPTSSRVTPASGRRR